VTPGIQTTEQAAPKWRFRLQVSLFLVAVLITLCITQVTATSLSTAWKTTLSGLFMLGLPPPFWLAGAAVMRKPGINFIKKKGFGFYQGFAPVS